MIVRLQLLVNKDDFSLLAIEICKFFRDIHQTRVIEIELCPLGDAYVCFSSTLDRERFIGLVF